MEHLAVVGLSWRQGGAHAIGQFTIPADEQPARLEQMRRDLHASGMVYLATCNRVEWIIDAEHGVELGSLRQKIFKEMTGRVPEPGEAERTFRSWVGEGAVEHLFLVTTGLESAKIGETDVQNQVRGALDKAREMDLLSPKLDLVLEEALQVARKVRRSTNLGRGDVSLAHIAEERIRRHVADHPGTVVLLGVAKMTRRCGEALADADIPMLVVNRTLARAEELASTIGARACTLDAFRDQPEPVSVILSSTGSKEPVLSVDTLRRLFALCPSGRGPLVIDLAIPPDVAPEDAVSVGIERIGMDEVIAEAERQRSEQLIDAAEARAFVDDAVASFHSRLADWSLGPAFAAVQRHYREAAIQSAEKALRRELRALGEAEQAAFRQWAEALARRLAHLPTAGIKGLAHTHGIPAVETFLHTAVPELARTVPREGTNGAPVCGTPDLFEKGAL